MIFFNCKAFYDLSFILNVQGQMTEKYYIISGKKKNKCVSLIMTNHQIVSDVFVLIMIKFGFNPGNHLVIGQESQPPPPPLCNIEDRNFSTSNSRSDVYLFVLRNRCPVEKG